jgi:putative transposase
LKRRLLSLHQRYPALGLDSLYYLIRPELPCSRKRIYRLMNELNISSARKRAYKATTNSRHTHPIAPNLLARRFSFAKPDTAWVGDITYIPTDEGWLYCAIVKDLCTKQIVGYAFSDRIDTHLTLAALDMATQRRKPSHGLIFHSDRGLQYAACAYQQRLANLGIRQSMSRKVILMTTPLPKTSSAVSNAMRPSAPFRFKGTSYGGRLCVFLIPASCCLSEIRRVILRSILLFHLFYCPLNRERHNRALSLYRGHDRRPSEALCFPNLELGKIPNRV